MSVSTAGQDYFVHWDAEIGTDQDIFLAYYVEDVATGDFAFGQYFDEVCTR